MRRTLLAVLALLLVLPALPAGAAPPVSCDDGGRERFTSQGLDLTMAAPTAATPELAATADATGQRATPYRSAQLPFVTDFAPAAAATVSMKLEWANPGDFDLYVHDADGQSLAVSNISNVDEGNQVWSEQVEFDIDHCTVFTIVPRNWGGSPNETLKLTATVTPLATQLQCADSDPAPNCAGKTAGQAPDPTPADTRTRLYLGGDPGQLSMAYGYNEQTTAVPFRGTLTGDKPTSGTPNQYTRPVAGFRDQFRNPFVPHFSTTFTEPRDLTNDVDALLWLSSPTLKDGGTLYADLYADGGLVQTVEIPGAQVPEAPTKPLFIRFPIGAEQALNDITSLTLQLATTPAVATTGPGNTADALFTVHYGGIQFPSRITLR